MADIEIGAGITIGGGISFGSGSGGGGGGTTYTLTVTTDYNYVYWLAGKSGNLLSFDVQSYGATQALLSTVPIGTVMTITDTSGGPPVNYNTTTTSVFAQSGGDFGADVVDSPPGGIPIQASSITFTI
jgi:hypothetical protein